MKVTGILKNRQIYFSAFLITGIILLHSVAFAKSGNPDLLIGNYFQEERKIFELVNKERRKYNLDDLQWNSELADLARSYSKKMAREKFFSHYDSRGNSVADRARIMKITKWKKIGENLFMCEGYEKYAYTAVKGWMKSPAHRDNILDENYDQTGIGIAKSSDGTIYVTQVFLQF